MIFPSIDVENIIQVNDRFRISASKSYISKGENPIVKVEIEPHTGDGFIDVSGTSPLVAKNWFTDWQYSTSGTKTISVRVTTDTTPTSTPVVVTVTKDVLVLTAAEDLLFSSDDNLKAEESDIIKYLPDGKNSFKYVHRKSQDDILEWLYTNGYRNTDGTRITKTEVLDTAELKYWSIYSTLKLIFRDLVNSTNDIFDQKAREYENLEHTWRHKYQLKIDVDKSGDLGEYEGFNLTTRDLIRR